MKRGLVTFALVAALMTTMIVGCLRAPSSFADEGVTFEVLDEIGTSFKLQSLNIVITTDTSVHISLRACSSDMISYFIENASEAEFTQLTLSNLEPLRTLYMYEDSYANENVFTTDANGSYTYAQDLMKLHRIFIQPESGTVHIYASTTLTSDIYDSVLIEASNVVLDLNGHSIIGTYTRWMGIEAFGETNVVIKNGYIRNHICGVYLSYCGNVKITNNTITSNSHSAVEMSTVWNSLITDNTFDSNSLEVGWGSNGNVIYHNNFIHTTCWFYPPAMANVWDNGYPSGGNYWSSYSGVDLFNGPNQDILGGDGIADAPFALYTYNVDHYPLMHTWTAPIETSVQVGHLDYPVEIASSTTIDKIVANKNALKFQASGPTGQKGYVSVVFPMVNTTAITVSIDNAMLHPPPFPVIYGNGTHYFIYFEFMLSTHNVTIQFAPINATANIDPDTLELNSEGQWITAYIELPQGYNVSDIDVSTVLLNNTVRAETGPTCIGDYDNDGIPDLMVKFDRKTVEDLVWHNLGYLTPLRTKPLTYSVNLTVTGSLTDGTAFQGTNTIQTIQHLQGQPLPL